MSPRGVAAPHLHERLFDAAQRLLLRDDTAPLTGRAVTREAGCAVGLLYNHFGDLDSFLAEFAIDRFRRTASHVSTLPTLVGEATVVENLTIALVSLFGPETQALSRLMAFHPGVADRAVQARATSGPARPMLEEAFMTYLDQERHAGRLADHTDTEAVAVALVATVHQLLLMPTSDGRDPQDLVRRVAAALMLGTAPPT